MGRGISCPVDTLWEAFRLIGEQTEDDDWYEDLCYDYEIGAKEIFPSLSDVRNKWVGREDKVLLENDLIYFGVSVYGGMSAIWIVAKCDHHPYTPESTRPLAEHLVRQCSEKLNHRFGQYCLEGVMSNGEQVFRCCE